MGINTAKEKMGTFIGSWGWRNTVIVLLVVSLAAILILSYTRSKHKEIRDHEVFDVDERYDHQE